MNIVNWPSNLQFSYLGVRYKPEYEQLMLNEGVTLPPSLARAMPKRRCEFLAGRVCAKRVLTKLHINTSETIKIGAGHQPLWPAGVSGSISHCDGHAVAVVVWQEKNVMGVGIDIENIVSSELAQSIHEQIISETERGYSRLFTDFQLFLTLIFSAKESIYKAIYPFIHQILDFNSVSLINVDLNRCELFFTYNTYLQSVFGRTEALVVRYQINDGCLLTWCSVSQKNLF
ncbi:phosphopantetheinyl transferase component of siderophore synthetase [Shewanella psychrophila]|uniref:Enterobactin synthase component D n=1 Tax=Shewanella psychrophila TaxID=225848 RepID=A0A1S6HN42_9GAMM|nr:4'-phosphopantetheinyl transferase superfamily protein [Shewanella psychrophila]AQS36924.1 phosphopantetheinyl transferase component of siderophore synthetase [Shewanella psychrophila]